MTIVDDPRRVGSSLWAALLRSHSSKPNHRLGVLTALHHEAAFFGAVGAVGVVGGGGEGRRGWSWAEGGWQGREMGCMNVHMCRGCNKSVKLS